jgi:hypothetical protein
MQVELLLNERPLIAENAFVEIVLWRLPVSSFGSHHGFKCRLALVVNGRCLLRYDNETGKGDHKHRGENEIPYTFTTLQSLLDDFWEDVDNWRI